MQGIPSARTVMHQLFMDTMAPMDIMAIQHAITLRPALFIMRRLSVTTITSHIAITADMFHEAITGMGMADMIMIDTVTVITVSATTAAIMMVIGIAIVDGTSFFF